MGAVHKSEEFERDRYMPFCGQKCDWSMLTHEWRKVTCRGCLNKRRRANKNVALSREKRAWLNHMLNQL